MRHALPATALLVPLVAALLAAGPATAGATGEPPPVTRRGELPVDGVRRTFSLRIPPECLRRASNPLLIVLHPEHSDAVAMERLSGFSELASRETFVVAYPDGTPTNRRRDWNHGLYANAPSAKGIDDVAFLDTLVTSVGGAVGIDPARIYVAGYASGGSMAERFAAERSNRVAAVAAVGASAGSRDGASPLRALPEPAGPVSVLLLHGRNDDLVPWEGGSGRRTPRRLRHLPVREAVGFWVFHDRCHRDPYETILSGGAVLLHRYPFGGDATEVLLVEYPFNGHEWFGGKTPAAERIWRFFVDHPKEKGY